MPESFQDCQNLLKTHQLCLALNNTMLLVNSTLEPDEIMNRIVVETAKGIGCESARIAIREGTQWRLKYLYRLPEELKGRVFSDEDLPHASLAMVTKKPVAINDAFNDNRTNMEFMRTYGIRSVLVLPLMEKEKVVGTLFFNYHSEQVSFEEAEIDYAEKVAAAVAVALQNARYVQDLKEVRNDLEEAKRVSDALGNIERIIYSTLDTSQIMAKVLETASDVIGAETAMIFSREGKEWAVRHVFKLSSSLLGQRFADEQVKHTAITADTKEPMAVTDAQDDDRVDKGFTKMLQLRSLLDLPLIVKGEVIGDLVFNYHSRNTEFTKHDIWFVKNLQNSISLALENARLFEALQESDSRLKEAERIGKFGYFYYDRVTGKMTWSDGSFSIFGRDKSMGEPTIEEVFRHYCIDPDCQQIREKVVREETSEIDVTVQRQGTPIHLHVVVRSLKDHRGNTIGRLGTVQDVTEQKAVENALRDSQSFKQGILDSLLEHIAVIDEKGDVVAINRRWLVFAEENGASDASRVGLGVNYLDISRIAADMNDPFAKTAIDGIEEVLAGRTEIFSLEYPCNSPSEERWFLMHAVRPSHDFKGVVISHLDISRRKRMEEELRATNEAIEATKAQLEAIIGSMNEGLVIADLQGNIQRMNPAALQLHEFRDLDEAQKHIQEYPLNFAVTSLDESPLPIDEWPLMKAVRGEVFTDYEIRVNNLRTGRVFIGSYSGGPVCDGSRTAILALLTIRDVTVQKRFEDALRVSEANYRTLFDSANDAMFIHDPDTGKTLDVNKKMLEVFKYNEEEALSVPVLELSAAPDVTQEEILRLIHAASELPQVFDWLNKDKEGNLFWSEVSLKKVVLQGEDRILAVVRDISERKQAEEELKRAMEQLSRSNRELEQFAYIASHDLQEPLRMVSSYMQLLEKKYRESLDEKAQMYIRYAADGANRMQGLIQGLLNYSRIGVSEYMRVDTNVSVADAIANLATAIHENKAEVSSGPLPAIGGDPTLMLQLFQNLISNGLKYRKRDTPPHIVVSAEQAEQEWLFSVRDNGIGIKKEDFDRIFQIFQRLHTREEYPGTGIGLASCKKIVEQHGGKIWLESTPGEGATFFFTIPCKAE